MRKLSEINEGMFSGMVRRSNTDQVKKEDKLDNLDKEQFLDYLKNHYTYYRNEGNRIYSNDNEKYNYIYVPIYYENTEMTEFTEGIFINYGVDGRKDIVADKGILELFPETARKIKDIAVIIQCAHRTSKIEPIDGDPDDVSNTFIIEIINRFLSVFNEKTGALKPINEGMFSGMVRRSNTDQVKKEDDVNGMDMEQLYDYMENIYEPVENHTRNKITLWLNTMIYLPLINNFDYHITYDCRDINNLRIGISGVLFQAIGREYYLLLKQKYNFNFDNKFGDVEVKPKDGEINNRFFLDVIDEFISNLPEPAFKKRVNEGMFSGMVRRSNTDQVKKEDNINLMNFDDLKDYIEQTYEPLDSVYNKIYFIRNILFLAVKQEYKYALNYDEKDGKLRIYIYKFVYKEIPDFITEMSKEYNLRDEDLCTFITPKNGEVNNQVFLNVLDKILSLTDKPAFKKRVNEGMFSGMVRRANSDLVKKEDEKPEIDKLKNYLEAEYEFEGERHIIFKKGRLYNFLSVPIEGVLFVLFINYWRETGEFASIQIQSIRYDHPKLYDKLKQNYNIILKNGFMYIMNMPDNDKSFSGITELIDFIINNIDHKKNLVISKKV